LDAAKVEGGLKLGESVGVVGIEEGVVVRIQAQRGAVGLEDAGEKIEMAQEGFTGVEPRTIVEPCGVVEDFQQDFFSRTVGRPGVRCGTALPEVTVIAGLSGFDGLGVAF
jgi:hypothetical protein